MEMMPKMAPARERGLTLLEVIVALALASLVVAGAVASVGGFIAQKTLAGWSESIVNDIRSAQQLATARRLPAAVIFTRGTPPTYAITIGSTTVRSQTLAPELVIASGTIQFDALGVPPSGATMAVIDTRNNQTVTISVAPVTGAVTVQ